MIAPKSILVMVGKNEMKSSINFELGSTLMLVIYELGRSFPALGDKIKKKFGEKLSHSISRKLDIVTVKLVPPAVKVSLSPNSKFMEEASS